MFTLFNKLFPLYNLMLLAADDGAGGADAPDPIAKGSEDAGADDGAAGKPAKEGPGPVPHKRFNEVNERAKAAEARIAELEATQKTSDNEQKKTEAELKAEQTKSLRLEVALEKKLPEGLVSRLKGKDKETLIEDADYLLTLIKPDAGPGIPPSSHKKQPKPPGIQDLSPEEVRARVKGKAIRDIVA